MTIPLIYLCGCAGPALVVWALSRGRTAHSVGEPEKSNGMEMMDLMRAHAGVDPRPTRMEPRPSNARPIRGATLAEYGTGYGGLLGALTREGQEIRERERREDGRC